MFCLASVLNTLLPDTRRNLTTVLYYLRDQSSGSKLAEERLQTPDKLNAWHYPKQRFLHYQNERVT